MNCSRRATVCQISAKLLSESNWCFGFVGMGRGGWWRGGVGIVTGSYFNSRRTFSSRMKYQIYRSLRRSETGVGAILRSWHRDRSDTSRETGQKFMAG